MAQQTDDATDAQTPTDDEEPDCSTLEGGDVERLDFSTEGADEPPAAEWLRAVDSVTVGYLSAQNGEMIETEIETEHVEEVIDSEQTYWFEGNPLGRESDCYRVDFGTVTRTTESGSPAMVGIVEYVDVPYPSDDSADLDRGQELVTDGGQVITGGQQTLEGELLEESDDDVDEGVERFDLADEADAPTADRLRRADEVTAGYLSLQVGDVTEATLTVDDVATAPDSDVPQSFRGVPDRRKTDSYTVELAPAGGGVDGKVIGHGELGDEYTVGYLQYLELPVDGGSA